MKEVTMKISINHPTKSPDEHAIYAANGWIYMTLNDVDSDLFTNFNYSFIHWENGTRKEKCFLSSAGVIVDYDDGSITADEVKQWLDENNINYIIVNSKSHKPEHHKIHVLLPFSKEVKDIQLYKAYVYTAMKTLPGTCDGCVHDGARFMGYTPKDKLQVFFIKSDGIYFDKFTTPNYDSKREIVNNHKQHLKSASKEFRKNTPMGGKWICSDELLPLVATKSKHILNCPLNYEHKHGRDLNQSAFLDYNEKNKNWYIFCSVCSNEKNGGRVFWMLNDLNFAKRLNDYKKGDVIC